MTRTGEHAQEMLQEYERESELLRRVLNVVPKWLLQHEEPVSLLRKM